LARLAGESGAHEGRVSAAFRGVQAEIAASAERFYVSQAKQLEMNARAERLQYKNDVLATAVRTSSTSSAKTLNRIEELKNEIESKSREIEDCRELTARCQSLTADLRDQRSRRDGQRVFELCQIRNEYRQTRYKIGRLRKMSERDDERVLTEALKKTTESLEAEEARRQHLAELAAELTRANTDRQAMLQDREAVEEQIKRLDEVQKAITLAEREASDLRSQGLRLACPTVVHREKVPECGKSLKQKLRRLNRGNEELRYRIGFLEMQMESCKHEVFLTKVNADHAASISHCFEPDDSIPAKTVALKRMHATKLHLIATIERLETRLANKKWNIELKRRQLETEMAKEQIRDFGCNVMLAVRPLVRQPPPPPRFPEIERLIWTMRCVQLERQPWSRCVDAGSAKAHLDSWKSQLDRF
jgi:chromosome segregation ATPase